MRNKKIIRVEFAFNKLIAIVMLSYFLGISVTLFYFIFNPFKVYWYYPIITLLMGFIISIFLLNTLKNINGSK
jgi:hypothetical protein